MLIAIHKVRLHKHKTRKNIKSLQVLFLFIYRVYLQSRMGLDLAIIFKINKLL